MSMIPDGLIARKKAEAQFDLEYERRKLTLTSIAREQLKAQFVAHCVQPIKMLTLAPVQWVFSPRVCFYDKLVHTFVWPTN